VMSISVGFCQFVCLFGSVSPELHIQTSPNVFCVSLWPWLGGLQTIGVMLLFPGF